MEKIEEEYEALHPDINLEIVPGKSEYDDGMLLTQIEKSSNDIYFLDTNTYMNYVNEGYFADITDVVTKKAYDEDMNLVESGNKSIVDSMWEDWKPICKIDSSEGEKYYAIPNYAAVSGIFYDADLFEENGWEVPATYPELIDLMDIMTVSGVTPFTFGQYDYIVINALAALYAQYEGANDFMLNSTLSGTDSQFGEISLQNGYMVHRQEGRKAAIKFAADLAKNRAYTTQQTRNGLTHLGAQKEFILSINVAETKENRIAMFLEQSYWERESKSVFDAMAGMEDEYGWGQRNFKYMPTPKIVGVDGIADSTNTKNTVYTTGANSFVAINANSDRIEEAKDFLLFVQSRRALALHTIYSGTLRPYDYKMTAAEKELCTPLGLSIYELLEDTNVEFVNLSKINAISKSNNTDFNYDWLTYTKTTTKTSPQNPALLSVEGRSAYNLFMEFSMLTVDEYFQGMQNYWNPTRWQTLLSKAQ